MEPVVMYPHFIPGGKRILFACGNDGLGLSVSTAPGGRWDHGGYYENQEGLPTQYEALIIKDLKPVEDGKWDFNFIKDAEPKGWLYIEEIGEICEAIEAKGLDGWDSWTIPWKEDKDVVSNDRSKEPHYS